MVYNRPNINYMSPEWARMVEWLNEDLQETYRRLAALDVTPELTQQLRGRASLIQQMLDFPRQTAGLPS